MTAPWLHDDVLVAAEHLLGWRIRSTIEGELVVAEIDEVEAYAGESDPASHAFRGRTARNGSMFAAAGGLYVYRSYGIHWCMNVVVGRAGQARAVLIRGGRVVAGIAASERRRGRSDNLANGPGKLTQALGVDGSFDGHRLDEEPLVLSPPVNRVAQFAATPRIGISKAVDRPWRFVVTHWEDASGVDPDSHDGVAHGSA